MAFDAKKHTIKIQGGRMYLPVAARLLWFREEHPDWSIVTSPVEINIDKQYSIFSCTIMNAEGRVIATATKFENIKGFGDYLEKSETGAVGRALAYCGYGTQFAPELEEEPRHSDTPSGSSSGSSGSGGNSGCSAEGCTHVMTASQIAMSIGKFGRPLCPTHQRGAAPNA